MKLMAGTIILTLLCMAALQGQPLAEVTKIKLSKISRGYEEHITITADSLHVWIENSRGEQGRTDYSRKVSAEVWTSLVNIVKQLKLKDLPALPSPTMKRAHDGAMHSAITVETRGGKEYTHGYDDENPHQAVVPLLKRVREVSGVEEKP
jgi:hypothetical protein